MRLPRHAHSASLRADLSKVEWSAVPVEPPVWERRRGNLRPTIPEVRRLRRTNRAGAFASEVLFEVGIRDEVFFGLRSAAEHPQGRC